MLSGWWIELLIYRVVLFKIYKMKDVVIVGSSGLAKEIAFLLEEINSKDKIWNLLGFVDNENLGNSIGKYKVVMNDEQLLTYDKELNVIIGVGFPKLLKRLATLFTKNHKLNFPNIIHPNCVGDWERIKFGRGNIITAGNILTTDISIGSFNIFNLNGTVGHDTQIGSYNVFNPTNNISGNIKIGNQIMIGTGAQVLQDLEIIDSTIIGAGAVLTKSVIERGVYVGAPAKKIK